MNVYRPSRRGNFADLARPVARLGLLEDLQLVLRGELAALGVLDQLGVRPPRRRGAPAGHQSQLGYASLVFVAGGSVIRSPGSSSLVSNILALLRSRPQGSLIPRW